ncbi:MAG: leucine-rich repeat protein [Bacteroidales bacterium]|nr:leucine-rich repeat protein [Bacteroidales bacterium]
MKKLLLTALLLATGLGASAYDFKVDGIFYRYNDDGTSVTVDRDVQNPYSGKVVIPEKVTYSGRSYAVTSIVRWAFANCSALEEVTIPNSVTNLEESVFNDSKALKKVTLGNGIKSIESWTFSGCVSLAEVVIPEGVEEIQSLAFQKCFALERIVLPASVTYVDAWAFVYCSSFKEYVVKPGNKTYTAKDGVLYRDNNTDLISCPKGKSGVVVVPEGVKKISWSAFYTCSKLTKVVIPNSVTYMQDYVFSECTSLSSIEFPKGMKMIDSGMLSDCKSLTQVTFPDSVYYIGNWACANCTELTQITLPAALTSLQNYIVQGCSKLSKVYCKAKKPVNINQYTFVDAPIATATLYVPIGTKAAYAAAPYWKDFGAIVEKDFSKTPGDINGDGNVNVSDITALINKILGTATYADEVCDINADGAVNVSDVTALINMILG